jgi:predicted ATPase
MGITSLSVKNFRSLRDATWNPGALNLVIGPNASGKTNLLRLLEFIKAVSTEKDVDEYIYSEGGTAAILWDGKDAVLPITLSVNDRFYYVLTHGWTSRNHQIDQEILYITPDNRLCFRRQPGSIEFPARKNAGWLESHGHDLRDWSSNTTVLKAMGPLTTTPEIVDFKRILSDWCIYRSFDTGPETDVRKETVAGTDMVLRSNCSNLARFLNTHCMNSGEFEDNLNEAMRAAFGKEYDKLVFPPGSQQRINFGIRWKHLENPQFAADLSDGTIRFLAIIAILCQPNKPSLIAFDEPEIGLHPSMFPIIAALAEKASEETQVVFMTHSPDFLSAFRKCEGLTTTIVETENSETRLRNVSEENLTYWLDKYTLGELFRTGELEDM